MGNTQGPAAPQPHATRLLAVEVLLADPQVLADDVLESCLYLLRDRLRGTQGEDQCVPAPKAARVLILVTVHATLSAGPAHLTLSAREGPAPGTWRYSLSDAREHRIQYGRIAGKTNHLDVLRYAAGMCRDAYQPGTTERGLLEQFADTSTDQRRDS